MKGNDPYWSRHKNTSETIERQDPIRWGSTSGPLSDEDLTFFEDNGYIVKPLLFSHAEIERLCAEAEHLAGTCDPDTHDDVVTEPGSQATRSIFRVHRDNAVFAALAADERLAGAARAIVGSDIYIHQSRINFKPGFDGREFFWHSDFETWHIEDGMPRMRAISASVLLTNNTATNGALMLIPGSHRKYVRCLGEAPTDHYKQSLKQQNYGVPDRATLRELVAEGGIKHASGPAGTVVFFDCNIMHASAANLSPLPRHNVFFVFNSTENQLLEPFGGGPPRPNFLGERE